METSYAPERMLETFALGTEGDYPEKLYITRWIDITDQIHILQYDYTPDLMAGEELIAIYENQRRQNVGSHKPRLKSGDQSTTNGDNAS